jgi:hypothetical protein
MYARGMAQKKKPIIEAKPLHTAEAVLAAFAEIDSSFDLKVNRPLPFAALEHSSSILDWQDSTDQEISEIAVQVVREVRKRR